MAITIATLIAAGLAPTQARLFAEPLSFACARFGLTTPARMAALVGQCRVESADFTRLEESLYYTRPERISEIFPSRVRSAADAQSLIRNPQALANRVYSGRLGNGDEASGDGWTYRGRGLIQLTGRDNYRAAQTRTGIMLLTRPDLAAEPTAACMVAASFLAANDCLPLADASDWDGITRRVNGPRMLESARRRQYCQQALEAFR